IWGSTVVVTEVYHCCICYSTHYISALNHLCAESPLLCQRHNLFPCNHRTTYGLCAHLGGIFTKLCAKILIVMKTFCNLFYFFVSPQQVKSITWENCDSGKLPGTIKSLSITRDPVSIHLEM
ncbi:hypothetical protein PRIEUP_LOCUS8340, partial [Pristimantis euphronides]